MSLPALYQGTTVTNRVMYFDGLTLVKEGPEHFTVYVRITDGEKKGQILVVHQTRVSKRWELKQDRWK
jgi:hypothetical protein